MKLSIIFAAIAVSTVALAHVSLSHASAVRAPKALVSTVSTLTDCRMPAEQCKIVRATNQDRDTVYLMPNTTIVGSAPRAKVWTCGNVEENRVGGSQRTCEFR